jgi:glycopeptide antibiotics resistance protein
MKAWQWWFLIVVAVSGPWFGIVGEPQWHRVTWIPFHGLDDKPRDMAANLLIWIPFGVTFARDRRGVGRLGIAVLASLGLSLVAEVPQLFYRLRDPSATDVFMAICGAAAGSLASQSFYGRDARGASSGREARQRSGGQQDRRGDGDRRDISGLRPEQHRLE